MNNDALIHSESRDSWRLRRRPAKRSLCFELDLARSAAASIVHSRDFHSAVPSDGVTINPMLILLTQLVPVRCCANGDYRPAEDWKALRQLVASHPQSSLEVLDTTPATLASFGENGKLPAVPVLITFFTGQTTDEVPSQAITAITATLRRIITYGLATVSVP